MTTPTVANYREDALYPRIARATDDLLRRGNVVAPVEVLIAVQLLTRARLEDWRRGRVPFLERVIHCNLTRLGRMLRILRFHAHDLNLKRAWTAYMRWGKGPKQLLFSLLRRIDSDPDSVIFFADEAGSWQVHVDWRSVLPSYFGCLAEDSVAEDFAREVERAIADFADHERPRHLAAARRVANAEQKVALRRLPVRKRRR